MSERDELAKVIDDDAHVDWFSGNSVELADAILAAGYRRPRTITTHEELAKMPKGSVVLSHLGGVWTKHFDHYMESDNWEARGAIYLTLEDLPVTVLHEGRTA